MFTKNDVVRIFDTVLSSPGMGETVKIDLKISRKNVLLLSHVIKEGIAAEKDGISLLSGTSKESLSELENLSEECLQKAGLVELNEKLNLLGDTSQQ